jgi:hypothetical protein
MSPRHRHVRVILTAGVMETLDEAAAARVETDAILRKPFEASALIAAVKPLAEAAAKDRATLIPREPGATDRVPVVAAPPFVAVVDEEQVRAAVTVALDASMAVMADEIAKRVLAALATRKSETAPEPASAPALATAHAPTQLPNAAPPALPAAPVPMATRMEPVRRVSPIRLRSGSILGLDISRPEPESSETDRD